MWVLPSSQRGSNSSFSTRDRNSATMRIGHVIRIKLCATAMCSFMANMHFWNWAPYAGIFKKCSRPMSWMIVIRRGIMYTMWVLGIHSSILALRKQLTRITQIVDEHDEVRYWYLSIRSCHTTDLIWRCVYAKPLRNRSCKNRALAVWVRTGCDPQSQCG